MIHDVAFPELVFGLRVGLGEVVEQAVEPLNDELVAWLGCDEIVFVGEVPVRLGVVDRIDLPLIEGTAVVWIEKHEDLRHLPVAIEHELRRIARDLDQPIQSLQQDIRHVHVHSSMLSQQCQPNQVRVGLLESSPSVVEEESFVDPLEVVFADVLSQVGLVYLNHLEAGNRGEELDVALGQLISRVAFRNTVVPEEPDQLWQG